MRGTGAPGTSALPAAGAFRVAANPTHLATGPWPRGQGPNRYDDPLGRFSVRYLSETLEGCLKERLAQFTRSESAEARIAAARAGDGVPAEGEADDLDLYELPPGPDPGPDDGLAAYLLGQRVAVIRARSAADLVEVTSAATIAFLDAHQRVRTVLGTVAVRRAFRSRRRPTLSAAMLVAVDAPRELTQAVSRAVFDDRRAFGGLAYPSCVDLTERCFAVFGRTRVTWEDEGTPLLDSGTHVEALCRAAASLRITLPPEVVGT